MKTGQGPFLRHGCVCGCADCMFKREQAIHGGEKGERGESAVRRCEGCGDRTKDMS